MDSLIMKIHDSEYNEIEKKILLEQLHILQNDNHIEPIIYIQKDGSQLFTNKIKIWCKLPNGDCTYKHLVMSVNELFDHILAN